MRSSKQCDAAVRGSFADSGRLTGIHVSQSQEKSTRFLGALGRARIPPTTAFGHLKGATSRLMNCSRRRETHAERSVRQNFRLRQLAKMGFQTQVIP
jgi:hypothetical protein